MRQSKRISEALRRKVRRRANGRCEYCPIPVKYDLFGYVVDHVIARQHGGLTIITNLALSCCHCNAHKGQNIASFDAVTKKVTPLFNPRTDLWMNDFRWNGPKLIGLSNKGRCTLLTLAINDHFKLAARASLMSEGLY